MVGILTTHDYTIRLSEWERRLHPYQDSWEWRRVAWVQAGTTRAILGVVAYQRYEDRDNEGMLSGLLGSADYQLQKALYQQLNDFQHMGDAIAKGLRSLCNTGKDSDG